MQKDPVVTWLADLVAPHFLRVPDLSSIGMAQDVFPTPDGAPIKDNSPLGNHPSLSGPSVLSTKNSVSLSSSMVRPPGP